MHPLPSRSTIERAVEALIDLLDEIDGDAEREPDDDVGADDLGEAPGQSFSDPDATTGCVDDQTRAISGVPQ